MYNTQTINLDMSSRDPCPRVVAKQGDAGSREVVIKLYDNGAPANINNQISQSGTEKKGVIRFCKPDGTGGIYDKTEDNLSACTLGGDSITVRLATQMLTCPGDVVADVAIICGATVISTFNFVVAVEPSPVSGITPSNNYYNYQSLAEINQAIDDAKAAAAEAVKSVNGKKPDTNGNVAISTGVAQINGETGTVSLPVNAIANCASAATAQTKSVGAVPGFAPVQGAVLGVRFANANTTSSPRLNYHGIEHPIVDRFTQTPIAAGDIGAGLYHLQLEANSWVLLDKVQEAGSATPVPGADGGWWIPAVGADGTLAWAASKDGMGDAPTPANIKGPTGANGGYYTPAATQPETGKMRIAFNPSKDDMPTVAPIIINLPTTPAEPAKIPVYACSSSADTAEKVIQGTTELPTEPGAVFAVQFANANTAAPSGLALLHGSGAYPLRLRIALPWQSQALLPQHIAAGMHYFSIANEDWVYLLNPYINIDALSLAMERGLSDA